MLKRIAGVLMTFLFGLITVSIAYAQTILIFSGGTIITQIQDSIITQPEKKLFINEKKVLPLDRAFIPIPPAVPSAQTILDRKKAVSFVDLCERKVFVVTAYYSPEKDQPFYYKGNYKDEVILNGEGLKGASGKKVFNGMLAAPATYSFGNAVIFPGFGVGKVEDRGGAIVEAGNRGYTNDRIDIWFGKGTEGLVKALTFGKRTLTGYLCDIEAQKKLDLHIGFSYDTIPFYKNFFDMTLRIKEMQFGRKDPRVFALQKYLVKLGFMETNQMTSSFDETTKASLCSYQVARFLLKKDDPSCGIYGPRTRQVLKLEAQTKGLLPENYRAQGTFNDVLKYVKLQQLRDQKPQVSQIQTQPNTQKSSSGKHVFTQSFVGGQVDPEIKILQEKLKSWGFYKGVINGIYDRNTIKAVYDFQLDAKITIKAGSEGFIGPATKKALNSR
ncbi:MAG TPA: peptidoglycan-binding protein [Candidatus Absconditabacterales bacterium]|nr:peptidoglycan-binding protein [Candidatus Absconditabacterales bacterium]